MAKKFRLREYHETVVARLREVAQSPVASIASMLAVKVGQETWLFNMSDVSEVLPLPDCAPVPLTLPWYLGVANIRGNLYGMADFSAYLGGKPVPVSHERRAVLINARHGANCGLVVNRVLGLRNPDLLTRQERPAADPLVAAEWQDQEGRVMKELAMANLAGSANFLEIGVFKRRSVFTNVVQQA
jgi:twitching motility protein PilI